MSTTSVSQNLDHVTAVATRFIEKHLGDEPLQWNEVIDHVKAGGYTDEATAAVTRAVLDLERTDVIFYALEGIRRPRPGDATPAPLDEVAAAVLSLQRPCTRNDRPGGSRSIWEAFEELGGRYRHCDVYDAMHERLKGHELKSGRVAADGPAVTVRHSWPFRPAGRRRRRATTGLARSPAARSGTHRRVCRDTPPPLPPGAPHR